MPTGKHGRMGKRAPPAKVIAIPPKRKFVSRFLKVLQRFPASAEQLLSIADEKCILEFFSRVARFADTHHSLVAFDPAVAATAILMVNFPEAIISCRCNPFRETIFHRSLALVAACFQVAIDCSVDEDEDSSDFLPPHTAKNFLTCLVQYLQVLRQYSIYIKAGQCRCGAGVSVLGQSSQQS
jgi:hypothetical protein